MIVFYDSNTRGVTKANPASEALRKLRKFLDANEPSLVRFLVTLWRNQGAAITYKELREAILAGDIDPEYIEQWTQDYSRLVAQHFLPAWTAAMAAATVELERRYPRWYYDPMAEGVRQWTTTRSADFVTNSTLTQIEGLRAVVQRAATLQDWTVDELSRVIRPMVGLTKPQTLANMRYYETLRQNGASPEKARERAIRYSARQHRYRGYNIARTELAFAYNQGSYYGTKQAQAAGYMGETVKVWCTADDERVCSICGGLEGKTIAMDEDFDFRTKLATPENPTIRRTPPAHPSCRCGVIFKEISPPRF